MQKTHVHTRIHTDARHREIMRKKEGEEGIDKRDHTFRSFVYSRIGRFCFIKLTDRTRDDDERKDDVKGGLC